VSIPAGLVPQTFASRLYDALGPLTNKDAANGWSLLILCNAIGVMYQEVEDLVRDTPAGPGWSELMDLGRCPPEALAWLGQFAGVRIPPGLTDAQARAWVGSTDGFKRGTPAAMIGACKATLTGTQTVLFHERYGGPATPPAYAYYLSIWTYASETPNAAATLAALTAQKPAGLVLLYATAAGQTYATVKATYATYAVVKSTFSTYDTLKASKPG
jgi:hypothetical protein